MRNKELIELLQRMPPEEECLLAIDQSAGWDDDYIEVYPIEEVYSRPWKGDNLRPLYGYCEEKNEEENNNKTLLYVFP